MVSLRFQFTFQPVLSCGLLSDFLLEISNYPGQVLFRLHFCLKNRLKFLFCRQGPVSLCRKFGFLLFVFECKSVECLFQGYTMGRLLDQCMLHSIKTCFPGIGFSDEQGDLGVKFIVLRTISCLGLFVFPGHRTDSLITGGDEYFILLAPMFKISDLTSFLFQRLLQFFTFPCQCDNFLIFLPEHPCSCLDGQGLFGNLPFQFFRRF